MNYFEIFLAIGSVLYTLRYSLIFFKWGRVIRRSRKVRDSQIRAAMRSVIVMVIMAWSVNVLRGYAGIILGSCSMILAISTGMVMVPANAKDVIVIGDKQTE